MGLSAELAQHRAAGPATSPPRRGSEHAARRVWWRPLLAGAGTLLLAACGLLPGSADAARSTHGDLDGPLSITSADGIEQSVYAPADRAGPRWRASFGHLLCVHEPRGAIRVEGARVETGDQPPAQVEFFLRTVGPAAPGHDRQERRERSSFATALGGPPRFAQQGAIAFSGRYTPDFAGTAVTRGCRTGLDEGFQDLVLTLTAGPAGGEITSVSVDYTVDDEAYTVTSRKRLVICGTAFDQVCGRR